VNRPADKVRIAATKGSSGTIIDAIGQFEIVNSLTEPSQALFEIGSMSSWVKLKESIEIGTRWAVVVNDRARLTGRMISRRLPVTSDAGATVQLTVRTVLADAAFASANPFICLSKCSIKDVILQAYAPLGLGEEDFVFSPRVARDIMTGKGGGGTDVDLEEIKEDAAKVHPPETIYAFVERHLARFHLTHWDAPDGRIVVGAPDSRGQTFYQLRLRRDNPQANNITSAEKIEDYEQTPSVLCVSGLGGGKDYGKAKVRSAEINTVLNDIDPPINRPVFVVDDAVKTQSQADSRARREMLARSRQTDAWTMDVPDLAYWDGSKLIPWGIDTLADVDVEVAGASARGAYLVHKTTMKGSASEGYSTSLEMVARGIWVL